VGDFGAEGIAGKSMSTTRQNSKPASGRLLTLPQATEYIGLSAWKLRSLIHGGKLPIVELNSGEKWWLDRRDLDALIERSKRIL
jgi:excisionase family DNA binding protein